MSDGNLDNATYVPGITIVLLKVGPPAAMGEHWKVKYTRLLCGRDREISRVL